MRRTKSNVSLERLLCVPELLFCVLECSFLMLRFFRGGVSRIVSLPCSQKTALIHAVESGSSKVVAALVAAKASLDVKDRRYIISCAASGHLASVMFELKSGCFGVALSLSRLTGFHAPFTVNGLLSHMLLAITVELKNLNC